MLRTLFFIILTSLSGTACSHCLISPGEFVDSGGSEQSTKLTLKTDNTFQLIHTHWQPGHYDKRKQQISNGRWQCTNNQLSLKFNDKVLKVKIQAVGNNPIGIAVKTKILNFPAVSLPEVNYPGKLTLYPKASLKD